METSEQLNELFTALATAQGAIQSAKKDAVNPFFKSQYATLDSIWNAIRSPLSTNELSVIQVPIKDQSGLKLITRLCHSSGQWMEGIFEVRPAKDDIQGIGSALTYARRYALAAMVGVTADEDDDGNSEIAIKKKSTPKNGKTEQPALPPPPIIENDESGEGIDDPFNDDPSEWLPGPVEFQEYIMRDFGTPQNQTYDNIKVVWKKAGYTGFLSSKATEMYNCLAEHFAPKEGPQLKMEQA